MKPKSSAAAEWLAAGMLLAVQLFVAANPTQGVVTQGSAVITGQGPTLKIQTSGNATINWATFNIAAGETTVFVEPSASSVVWNHINDPNPSQILGHLDANGYVVLQNQSGFYIGGNAVINAAGLIMTTTPAPPPDTSSGSAWQFNAPPPTASIINYGQINAGASGPVFLIAHNIENNGTITAPGGQIGLYAGEEVLVSSRPDGRGLSATVTLPQGSVNNSGSLIADAGTIALHAQVVNQGGLIQANSVREQNGVIDVVASDSVTLGASSVIEAKGDSTGASPGGSVTIQSGNQFSDTATSTIDVSGGAEGGNGGQVHISALQMNAIQSQIEGQAAAGWTGGQLLIDPVNITLSSTGTSATSGTVNEGDSPDNLTLNPNSFSSFSQILLQASKNITLSTPWNLADSATSASLELQAGNNITLSQSIIAGQNWNVTLVAGASFSTSTGVTSGTGTVSLTGSAYVQTQNGNINVTAGNGVTIASGAIRTIGGGSIDVTAASGNINTGNNQNGYVFKNSGYTVSPNLGGISTAAGGDVTIDAEGGNVTSYLPTATTSSPSDAGSGAFGSEPGVVTVMAHGSVFGNYIAADSVESGAIVASTITAQTGNAGTPSQLLALNLVKGGWQVNAPDGSINLQEVRNPNGVFNGATGGSGAWKFFFDYDPNSFVDLNAGDAVSLAATALPRYTGYAVPVIYPPTLAINAGAGGVTLGNNVTLFPSASGNLTITTTGGGSLQGETPSGGSYTLAMSDSGATSWTSAGNFASDHAATPVQLNNPQPVVFNISGDVDDITIVTPKETQITVAGNMNNTSFSGQNLHPGDTTFLNVAGQIFNQNVYSFVTLTTPLTLPPPLYPSSKPDYLQVLENAVVPGSGPNSANGGALFPALSLFYEAATHQLGYYGQMDQATEQLLLSTFQEKTFFPNGKPILDANGNYVTKPATFNVSASIIAALYTASQSSASPSSAPLGYLIGGPGHFDITAQSFDLGVTGGVISEGPALNASLVPYTKAGAAIDVLVQGDLDLFASQISSYYGGAIDVYAGGTINAGLETLPFGTPDVPHGIWTSGHSDVSVIAQGDINVAGARIAAFDGGNIFVESLDGNVDAGSGDFSEVKVNEVIVNPKTGAVTTPQQPIAGSGILATTLPNAPKNLAVGNITVLTPQGDIDASTGGIAQEPLNGNGSLTPTLTLTAGTRDSNGDIVHPGNIDASHSGVIGINTYLSAAGDIKGLVIARANSTITAVGSIIGTFLSGGTGNFNAGGPITGIAIAGGALNFGNAKFEGVALSQNVSGGGAQSALPTAATASSSSQTAAAQSTDTEKAQTSDAPVSTDEGEAKRKQPLLAKYTGRVTVVLPKGQ